VIPLNSPSALTARLLIAAWLVGVQKPEIATATVAGTFGYLGGSLFTLRV
jgi:hypothetical protein